MYNENGLVTMADNLPASCPMRYTLIEILKRK